MMLRNIGSAAHALADISNRRLANFAREPAARHELVTQCDRL